ncbi:methylase [Rhodococcoides trifolii]|uniref:peptide chain release factor N(5)-glutamine methyltransferase n=1 Tax=Rhodococcoides trifolii TaxID=908250 RepID=A0A917G652_9NOCA|nr:putative protein N(5)-glutamine methyltransferase [Rhodococcus trifolii]GGG23753.1 methylase [Rhodococcus trifolii]
MSLVQHDIVTILRRAGCVFAEDEARLLIEAASSQDDLADMVRRRVDGLPLEQILGWAEFCGLRVVVQPGVFVPRKRTEFLVRRAASMAAPGDLVVDLCCGTGALGVALSRIVDGIHVVASDLDPAAVRCARANVEPLGGRVFGGDLFDALPRELMGTVDLLLVNAPYVPSDEIAHMPPEARDHEPRVALDGGRDGVDVHRRVGAEARRWLAPGGHLFVETSVLQAPVTVAAVEAGGLVARVESSEEVGGTVVIGSVPTV